MALTNLLTRILTGAVFVVVIICSIVFNQYIFGSVFLIIELLALHEFYRLMEKSKKANPLMLINLIGGAVLFVTSFLYFSSMYPSLFVFVPYLIYFLILFISVLYVKKSDALNSLAYSIFGQIYIAVPFSLLNFLAYAYEDNAYHYIYLLALLILIWINDSFAYLTGSRFGKHRLFERISPKKSWEGSIGGAFFTLIVALVFSYFYTNLLIWGWIGFAFVVIIFGTFGDLIESLIKRTLNIKDSGNVLPGHGGILDRFDSMIFAIPALFIYVLCINTIHF